METSSMNMPAGISAAELAQAPYCAGPDPNLRKPAFKLPTGAIDCHAHVFGPISRYQYSPKRIYTPPDAPPSAYWRMLGVLGVQRAVLVQPSVYGTDNRAMLDAMAGDKNRLRGVAVVEESVSDAELERMHEAGVRGIRFNIVDVKPEEKGRLPIAVVRSMAERIKSLGWHIQFLMHVDEFPELDRDFGGLPVDVVIDHFGYMNTAKGRSSRVSGIAATVARRPLLGEIHRGLSHFAQRHALRRRHAVCPCVGRSRPGACRMGHRLAPSQARQIHAERWRDVQSPPRLDSGREAAPARARR
jgi:predicted TIM-barrel fold metal-dependent hydrolase